VAHRAEMAVDPPHQRIPRVPEFLPHRIRAHRCVAVERLEARGAVRMPEDVRRNILCEPRGARHALQELAEIAEGFSRPWTREEESGVRPRPRT